ncbi:hypothetical protein CSE16_11210 [Solibacillus sp. R5-41]|uniref:hypothetical protein n=1 Tax=Solibacillus sp. R5-41 TaxID=2048654 RepID=UPI000C1273F6|nr:hypothetical protein [Solibacillus sp. R5-41]ATP40573.1 hypothetical protein CSE16_11210 [Solibacillus sp. R5-41]
MGNPLFRVGTPFNENGVKGVKFDKEITNSKSIESLRTLIKKVRDIDEPNGLNKESNIFFSLDRPKDGISEIRLYIWYQDDGSSILKTDSNSYFALTKEHTNELKNILEQ